MKVLIGMLAGMSLLVTAAKTDVILSTQLSGTGDNVTANTEGATTTQGTLNGKHLDLVDYSGLSAGYTGASSGNDIKFSNTVGLTWEVFDPTNTFEINTTDQVFSLKGSGDVSLVVQAFDKNGVLETPFTFDLGTIGTGQSGFTLTTLNGETMGIFALLDTGGTITDFEHNRITAVNNVAATPSPAAAWMFAGGLGILGLVGRKRRRSTTSILGTA